MALVSVHREKSLQYSRHYQGKLIFHYSCFPGEGLPWSSTAPAASASTFTHFSWASLVAQRLKRLPALQVTWVQSLGREDTLEKEMATHSSILAWRIPWAEEPGGLYSPWGRKESDMTEWLSTIWGHYSIFLELCAAQVGYINYEFHIVKCETICIIF